MNRLTKLLLNISKNSHNNRTFNENEVKTAFMYGTNNLQTVNPFIAKELSGMSLKEDINSIDNFICDIKQFADSIYHPIKRALP